MKIVIPGSPIPWARPRFRRLGDKLIAYDKQAQEKGYVRKLMMEQTEEIFGGDDRQSVIEASNLAQDSAFDLTLYFYMDTPKSRSTRLGLVCNKKPDLDNLVKFIFDAGNGVLWSDDRFIVALKTVKIYATEPRTEIYIHNISKTKMGGRYATEEE